MEMNRRFPAIPVRAEPMRGRNIFHPGKQSFHSPFRKGLYLVICLGFILGQQACIPTPSTPITGLTSNPPFPTAETNIPYLTPTRTPKPVDLPTETPALTQTSSPPLFTVMPLVTPLSAGESPFFDSWSPDGNWIAFWWVEFGRDTMPGSLAFVQAESGKICSHPEVSTEGVGYGRVHWEDDGRAWVVSSPPDQTFTGAPCETFLPSEPLPQPVGDLSPDGLYLASTLPGLQGPIFTFTTTITDLNTSHVMVRVPWEFSPNDAQGGGPQWLNNQVYLLGPVLNQGFLYVSIPDGKVGTVITDLLGLDKTLVMQYRSIFSQVDPGTGTYHLLLKWEGGPTPLPLLLYHGEQDELEEIPFYSAWPFERQGGPLGFSPDGAWLLLGDPVEDEPILENRGGDYWLRPVDPPGSTALQLPANMVPGGLSLQVGKMAFYDDQGVYLISFPDGTLLGQWSAPGYDALDPLGWSADGNRLAVIGHQYALNQTALFVIEP